MQLLAKMLNGAVDLLLCHSLPLSTSRYRSHSNWNLASPAFWLLLIFAWWPFPIGGAENPSIAFVCELKKQVRVGLLSEARASLRYRGARTFFVVANSLTGALPRRV
jgi:hypothetical protein